MAKEHALGKMHSKLSDTDLLRQFSEGRSEAAFETLVKRYAGLVLSVCERTLGCKDEAQDAFQATFLALSASASSIRRTASLGGWLHRVAVRASIDLLRKRSNWSRSVRAAAERRPSESKMTAELRELIDTEIDNLPEKFRAPIVMHCLHGMSQKEVGKALGIPVGTVSSRISRGYRRLRTKFTSKGVALTSSMLVALALETKKAAASGVLIEQSVKSAVLYATASNAATQTASPVVLTITEEILRQMFISKLRTALVGFVGLLGVAMVGVAVVYAATDGPKPIDKLRPMEFMIGKWKLEVRPPGGGPVISESTTEWKLGPGGTTMFATVSETDLVTNKKGYGINVVAYEKKRGLVFSGWKVYEDSPEAERFEHILSVHENGDLSWEQEHQGRRGQVVTKVKNGKWDATVIVGGGKERMRATVTPLAAVDR